MIKLAAGQKSGVARNVGNQQIAALGHWLFLVGEYSGIRPGC